MLIQLSPEGQAAHNTTISAQILNIYFKLHTLKLNHFSFLIPVIMTLSTNFRSGWHLWNGPWLPLFLNCPTSSPSWNHVGSTFYIHKESSHLSSYPMPSPWMRQHHLSLELVQVFLILLLQVSLIVFNLLSIHQLEWWLYCQNPALASCFTSVQFISVAQSCPTLCNPMNRSTPGLPVHHQLPEFTQTHVHRVGDAIQPSHPWSSPSPPAPNPSQHQSLFQWVNSLHEVAKVLEFQL